MNFIRRAGLYLVRKKGRTVLMTLLLFLMSCFVLVGISFKESAEKELERLRRSMASGFLLKVNTQNEMYRGQVSDGKNSYYGYAGPKITEELIDKICSVDGVKGVSFDFTDTVWTDLELKPGMWANTEPDEDNTEEFLMAYRHETDIYPCKNGELHKNFRTGALAIAKGRNIEEGDHFKAVISDWLAEKNHLSVGDTVTLECKEGFYQASDEPMKTWGEPVEAEIVGLFHANFNQQPSENTFEACFIDNVIYTDMDTFAKLEENEAKEGYRSPHKNGHITAEFAVEDPGQMDFIMQQVKSREDIDLENMELEADTADYQAAASPYRQIRVFAMLLLALGLCGIGMILYLTLKLWVQGRQREIGILYSVGMKKREILGQMLAECLLVAAVAVVTAFLLSGVLTDKCADAAERLTAPRTDIEGYVVKIDGGFRPSITKTSSDEVTLEHKASAGTIGFVALFVFGISSVSVMLSFSKISSLEPRKLLM